jgi:hypothetical protein
VSTTASAATPDPKPSNNTASGTWKAVCTSYRNCGM